MQLAILRSLEKNIHVYETYVEYYIVKRQPGSGAYEGSCTKAYILPEPYIIIYTSTYPILSRDIVRRHGKRSFIVQVVYFFQNQISHSYITVIKMRNLSLLQHKNIHRHLLALVIRIYTCHKTRSPRKFTKQINTGSVYIFIAFNQAKTLTARSEKVQFH